MSRDQQRYRKIYSYYRVQPRTDTLEVIVDESLDWKRSVRAASAASHALSGAGTTLTVGGVTIVDEDRVLLKDQSTGSQNGIYYFEVTGGNYVLTRASDSRQGTLTCGAATYVEEGTHAGKIFILSTNDPVTVGSTSLTWTQFASGGGGTSPEYWSSTTSGSIYTTGSVVVRGGLSSVDAASDLGTDVFFFVSGSITGSGADNKKSVFGGDVVLSGSLQVAGDQVEITGSLSVTNGISGSLTKLTNGSSYIVAGTGISVVSASNGQVTIAASASGLGGSGTANFIPKFATSTTLGDSILQEGSGINYIGSNSTFLTSSGYGITFPNAQVWAFPSNTFALDINGKFKFDTFSGNLGIGTPSSAAQKIHVAINNGSTSSPIVNDSTSIIRFQNFDTTSNNSTSIINADGNGGDINSYIQFINVDHFSNKGALAFGTRNGASSGTRIRIDEDGNVGIGSVTPTSVGADVFLFVSGSSGSLGTTDRGVSAFGGDVIVSGSLKIGTGSVTLTSNNIQFGSTSMRVEKNGNDMKFFDISNPSGLTLSELAVGGGGGSSPEYWSSPSSGFIYSTGSVGIGSTVNDSSYKLNVYQTTNFDDLRVKIEQAGADYSSKLYLVGGNSFLTYGDPYGAPTNEISSLYRDGIGDLQPMWRIWGGSVTSNMAFDTGGVEAMRINASQNVGIGTSTLTARVNVLGSNGNIGMIVQGGTTAPAINKPILQVKGYDGGVVLHVSGSSTHGARVGIGTTNPREICRLDVGSKASTATDNYVAVNAATTGECGFSWSDGGTQLWKFQRAASTSNISLVESGASNIALLCEYSTGNVGINTSNPSEKLHIDTGNIKVDTSGYGVRLASSPSNADAQTLDAYYEADLSAVIDCSGNEGNGVYVLDVAYDTLKMTRVGRLVTIGGDLRIDSLGDTPSGRLYILLGTTSGQYPSMDTAASVYVTGAIDLSGAIASSIQAYVEASTDKMYIDGYLDGSKVDIATQVGAGVTIKISVTYAV